MSSMFSSLSEREQYLLWATVSLVALVLLVAVGYKGYEHIRILDRQISNNEQMLLNLCEQTLQTKSVDAAFAQVVSEHSSVMTKEEIHDSLRREIYRLAQKNPNIAESEQKGTESEKYLIQIPVLREGVLREEGDGYREYQIRFRVPTCTLKTALEFLKRLEQSNQLLRIDSFEMARPHASTKLSLTIEVTRTVLSDVEIEVPDPEEMEWGSASLGYESYVRNLL